MSNTSKQALVAGILARVAGIQQHLAGVSSVTLRGVAYTPAALIQVLESLVTALHDVAVAEGAYKAKLLSERTLAPGVRVVIRAFDAYLRVVYGNQPDVLKDFGLAPPKSATPLTAEEKALAVARRKATRAARHTMGPKQKKLVKGTVAAPAESGSPAAPAAGGATKQS
jgi:hypothetical protein